ncbi:MAG: hypothetical protein GEU28_04260 [Dehalococcoidia bacterium]|nr:hypothetical protein [Dehalococcoidia bacterium]
MDGASMANFLAVIAAREWIGAGIRERGVAGRGDVPRLVMYVSAQAHSSLSKAGIAAGVGQENIRLVAVDAEFRMDAAALAAAIAQDIATGHRPFFAAATVGTTSTAAIDPVAAIADVCQEQGVWLHVDGAYGVPRGGLSLMGSDGRTRSWSIRTSGCSHPSTAAPSTPRIRTSSEVPSVWCRSTCARPKPTSLESVTTWTMACNWGGASGR